MSTQFGRLFRGLPSFSPLQFAGDPLENKVSEPSARAKTLPEMSPKAFSRCSTMSGPRNAIFDPPEKWPPKSSKTSNIALFWTFPGLHFLGV